MKQDKKQQLQLLAKEWYRPGSRGEKARQLLAEHPDYFDYPY